MLGAQQEGVLRKKKTVSIGVAIAMPLARLAY
jgi:hypothetical protein